MAKAADEQRPFASRQDALDRVPGLGEERLQKLEAAGIRFPIRDLSLEYSGAAAAAPPSPPVVAQRGHMMVPIKTEPDG